MTPESVRRAVTALLVIAGLIAVCVMCARAANQPDQSTRTYIQCLNTAPPTVTCK